MAISKPLAVKMQGLSRVFISGINETLGDRLWGDCRVLVLMFYGNTEQTPLASSALINN